MTNVTLLQPETASYSPYAHPGTIGPAKPTTGAPASKKEAGKDGKNIWKDEEVLEATETAFEDCRAEPE